MCDASVEDRVPRFLKTAGGDATLTGAFGMTKNCQVRHYDTTYPPIIKFLDLGEVVTYLTYWYAALTRQAAAAYTVLPVGPASYVGAMPCTARQFAIAVRQCVLAMFGDSQALTQHMTPSSTATEGLEALRVGSNCYPQIPKSNIRVPCVLLENLRNLQMTTYTQKTKHQNDRNVQVMIPCWSYYKTFAEINPKVNTFSGGVWTYTADMFAATSATDPNVIDCTGSGGVIDVNNSTLVSSIIDAWNYRVNALQNLSVPTAILGGSSAIGGLLGFTRHVEPRTVALYENDPFRTEQIDHFLSADEKSKFRNTKEPKDIRLFFPSGTGCFNTFTTTISSYRPLTATATQMLPYMILPIYPYQASTLPTQVMTRVASNETKRIDVNTQSTSIISTRGGELLSTANLCAPGRNGTGSEMIANVINQMELTGKGGYMTDFLQGAGHGTIDAATDLTGDYMKMIFDMALPFIEKAVTDGNQ
jgi:hypothetical protein